MKRAIAVFLCWRILSGGSIYAAESDGKQQKSLLDIACKYSDSYAYYVYEELQALIDQYLLPGYIVEGKKVFTYYNSFDWLSEGSGLPDYIGGFFIFEDNLYYQLEGTPLKTIFEKDTSEIWKTVLNFLQGDKWVIVGGAQREIESVTCVSATGILLYLGAKNGSTYVRHYDYLYGDETHTGEVPYRDYLLEDFNAYRARYKEWLRQKYFHVDASYTVKEGNRFAEYMNAGAPETPSPRPQETLPPKENPNSGFAWYVYTGIFAVSGLTALAAVWIWLRRNKKQTSKN